MRQSAALLQQNPDKETAVTLAVTLADLNDSVGYPLLIRTIPTAGTVKTDSIKTNSWQLQSHCDG
jgi:hypothetical protein